MSAGAQAAAGPALFSYTRVERRDDWPLAVGPTAFVTHEADSSATAVAVSELTVESTVVPEGESRESP